jgi:hypothetical protein
MKRKAYSTGKKKIDNRRDAFRSQFSEWDMMLVKLFVKQKDFYDSSGTILQRHGGFRYDIHNKQHKKF